MQIESEIGLLIQLLLFFITNTFVTVIINKRLVTGSFAFWSGWLFLIGGTLSFINNGFLNNFSLFTINTISTFHRGACVGFLIGSILVGSRKRGLHFQKRTSNLFYFSKYLTEKISHKVINILLIVGIIFFVQRISVVGFNLNFFTSAREIYLEKEFNFFSWLGTHLSVIVYTFIIIQGVFDGFEKMNLKKLFKIILYCSPLFLANATRTFLLYPFIYYFSSLLLIRSSLGRVDFLLKRKEIVIFSSSILTFLIIFAVIGFYRGGYGNEFNLYLLILSWPVSTSFALESWLIAANNSQSLSGLLSFEWFINFFDKLGLMDYSSERDILDNIKYGFQNSNNPAHVIPKSIIPEIIFDFGVNSLFLVTLVITMVSQIVSISFLGRGLIKHTIATLTFIAMFMTIQTSIFSAGFITSIFWVSLINYWYKNKRG